MADSPTISLALGGGGARGLAHIGVIQWLTENGYDIRHGIFDIAFASMEAMQNTIARLLYERLGKAGELEASHRFVRALRPLVPDKLRAHSFVVQTFRYDQQGFRAASMDLEARPRGR